jgi:hypothetical protein
MPVSGAAARSPEAPIVSTGTGFAKTSSDAVVDDFLGDRKMKLLLGMTLMATIGTAYAADVSEIEKRRLFQPTQAELLQEATGRIYIYDGLSDADIDRAMEAEFGRVESMMFVRVKKTDARGQVVKNKDTGEPLVEDDGC